MCDREAIGSQVAREIATLRAAVDALISAHLNRIFFAELVHKTQAESSLSELLPKTEPNLVFIHLREVVTMTGLSRATIYRRLNANEFPAPAKIGGAARWSRTEVDEWISRMLAARSPKSIVTRVR